MSISIHISNADNTTLKPLNVTLSPVLAINYQIPIAFLLLYIIAIVENVTGFIFLMKKSKTDTVFIVMACLAISNTLLATDGCFIMVLFLYILLNTPFGVPSMLCSVLYACWLLATQISTTLIMLISIIRVVSVSNILKKSIPKRVFTRKRVIALVAAVWLISVLVCMMTVTVDYNVITSPPTFCRFRTSLSVLRVTTRLYLVLYIINYVVCVSLYAISICILVKVHHIRRKVNTTELPNRNTHDKTPPTNSSDYSSSFRTNNDTSIKLTVSGHVVQEQNQRSARLYVIGQSKIDSSRGNRNIFRQQLTPETSVGVHTDTGGNRFAITRGYKYMSTRQSRELTATLIVGMLIVLHSACIIPWIVDLFELTKDTDSNIKSFLAILFGIVNMLMSPVIYILSLPETRRNVWMRLKCRNT